MTKSLDKVDKEVDYQGPFSSSGFGVTALNMQCSTTSPTMAVVEDI